jgi:hypothetical protein
LHLADTGSARNNHTRTSFRGRVWARPYRSDRQLIALLSFVTRPTCVSISAPSTVPVGKDLRTPPIRTARDPFIPAPHQRSTRDPDVISTLVKTGTNQSAPLQKQERERHCRKCPQMTGYPRECSDGKRNNKSSSVVVTRQESLSWAPGHAGLIAKRVRPTSSPEALTDSCALSIAC